MSKKQKHRLSVTIDAATFKRINAVLVTRGIKASQMTKQAIMRELSRIEAANAREANLDCVALDLISFGIKEVLRERSKA